MHAAFRQRIPQLSLFVVLAAATALAAQARGRAGPEPGAAPPAARAHPPRVEVAFVLDTTGSMSGLIEGAKQKIWSLANELASGQPRPQVRVALVAYRDRGDAYVTRQVDLSDDLDAVSAALFGLQAEGGGDTPESVNQALHEAVTRLSWSRGGGVYRVVFLVGDAPPHDDYAQDVPWAESVALARQRGIVVNTVQCGEFAPTTPVWQEIALRGRGQYAAIAQDGAMVALATPHDEELARLGRELAATALPWGAAEEQEALRAKLRGSLAAQTPAAASRLGYLAKSSGRVNAGRPDLVDAVREGLVDLAEVPAPELPEEMRALDGPARAALLAEKRAEREALAAQVADLTRGRDAWLRAENARRAAEGRADAFDDKVLEAIRSQAAEQGIAYE